jgi:hypothetical protein
MRSRLPVASGALLAAFLVMLAPAAAQTPVQQDGRLLDANPALGGDRFNTARPMAPLLSGNPYANGNVRYGLALQSFSPISDPTAFRSALGTGALSTFLRDSVSTADYPRDVYGGFRQPYFDASQTAPTAAFLQGLGNYRQPLVGANADQATTSGAGSLGMGPLNTRLAPQPLSLPPGQPLRNQIVGLTPGWADGRASSIFGTPTGLPSPAQLYQQQWPQANAGLTPREQGREADRQMQVEQRGNQLPWSAPLATPLDTLIRGNSLALLEQPDRFTLPGAPTQPPAQPGAAAPRPLISNQPRAGLNPLPGVEPIPAPRDASMLPGNDVFTDMQLALTLQQNPGADWYKDMQETVREHPALADPSRNIGSLGSTEFTNLVTRTPIRTFVGKADSAFNDQMLKAERLLQIGQYYDAEAGYEHAAALDSTNPLPLIGRAHAALGAGDYHSAALFLARGLERFPEFVHFNIDLQALMGGGEVTDIRRADIMRLLAGNEDARLRFLLGYIEYNTGNRQSGLTNLEKAAAETEPTSFIARFPAFLRNAGLQDAQPPGNLERPAPVVAPRNEPAAPAQPLEEDQPLKIPPPVRENESPAGTPAK